MKDIENLDETVAWFERFMDFLLKPLSEWCFREAIEAKTGQDVFLAEKSAFHGIDLCRKLDSDKISSVSHDLRLLATRGGMRQTVYYLRLWKFRSYDGESEYAWVRRSVRKLRVWIALFPEEREMLDIRDGELEEYIHLADRSIIFRICSKMEDGSCTIQAGLNELSMCGVQKSLEGLNIASILPEIFDRTEPVEERKELHLGIVSRLWHLHFGTSNSRKRMDFVREIRENLSILSEPPEAHGTSEEELNGFLLGRIFLECADEVTDAWRQATMPEFPHLTVDEETARDMLEVIEENREILQKMGMSEFPRFLRSMVDFQRRMDEEIDRLR